MEMVVEGAERDTLVGPSPRLTSTQYSTVQSYCCVEHIKPNLIICPTKVVQINDELETGISFKLSRSAPRPHYILID